MFVFGIAINKYHDHLLTSLKKNSTGSGKSSYSIPVGGLFEYVSCANYFGEVVEWFGVFMLTKGTPQVYIESYLKLMDCKKINAYTLKQELFLYTVM